MSLLPLRHSLLALLLLVLTGCAAMQPNYEKPTVNITRFEPLPSNNLVPKFAIGLHVINPNRTALTLQGLVYTVELEGHKLITGVANDLPVIEAYGEGDITLQASADLLGGIRLLKGLIDQNDGQVDYTLTARLNVSNLLPDIVVTDSGQLDLNAAAQ